ncbi:2-isopropylmalate synthase [Alkalibaculum sp. M08DMB]|uniref:2-isopropylmalate synthase n=1 Tax=Alkalibaculum sporogenes TaxID=2655001 RepID=A0A6A7KAQ3_9FIRM|nr:2-isopropylmalate synthase [Alkalibaculum sporogenes]MPW26590.1 2-isopropylmalate synthase [Alkalibaculum sporogenes]
MKNYEKYKKGYFMPPVTSMNWASKDSIDESPIWCSVDLRDGNQSLIIPMDLEKKIEFFTFLVSLGFKEIEVGFPAASETEFNLLRRLIEEDLIPDDVTIQVLTQSREHIIKRTFEALKGAKNAVVHLYNSTSVAQREQVFKKSKSEIIALGVTGAKLLNEYANNTEGNFRFEYSPESFTGTEMEFALEICNEVLEVWKPTSEKKVIINLPSTVQVSMPHVYASQIEYISSNLKFRDNVIISIHPHNDRGTAVAEAELGLLAGAQRVEGTLFGNGERTGNVDIITLALNMFSQGINPNLNLENIPHIVSFYEKMTCMEVSQRHPYSGELVFAAFSGSHQDAIAKGMEYHDNNNLNDWRVPYLPLDPKDIGREYASDVIRINSQSGKGGIGFLLKENYGYDLPPKMREDLGYTIKNISDKLNKELKSDEIYELFKKDYINNETTIKLIDYHFVRNGNFHVTMECEIDGIVKTYTGIGNGRLDAVANALKSNLNVDYSIQTYSEHSLEIGSDSLAAAYVGITVDNKIVWGVGVNHDIINASIKALISAINRK